MTRNLKLREIFRVTDWWQSKAALLMGFVYLYAAWMAISFERMIELSLLSAVTIAGFASLGYLSNDFFDREKDLLAGKRNFLLGRSPILIFSLFVISLLLLVLPWWYLPFTLLTALFIGSELLLFFLYSVKPFRFKESGVAGLITDTLYAHVVPVLLALYTFSLAAAKPVLLLPVVILALWQMISGLRNILIHQHEDVGKDKLSGMKNFVARVPANQLVKYVKLLLISELFLSVLFFLSLSIGNYQFVFCVLLILFFALMIFIVFYNHGLSILLQTRWRYFPNPVFEKWMPVALLIILSSNDLRFFWFIPLHILVFNFSFLIQVNHYFIPAIARFFTFILKGIWYKFLTPARILLSLAANYFIYFLLRLFNIDLKKEQTTALGYFKKKITGK